MTASEAAHPLARKFLEDYVVRTGKSAWLVNAAGSETCRNVDGRPEWGPPEETRNGRREDRV